MFEGSEYTKICTLTETTFGFETWAIHLHSCVSERLRGSIFYNLHSFGLASQKTWRISGWNLMRIRLKVLNKKFWAQSFAIHPNARRCIVCSQVSTFKESIPKRSILDQRVTVFSRQTAGDPGSKGNCHCSIWAGKAWGRLHTSVGSGKLAMFITFCPPWQSVSFTSQVKSWGTRKGWACWHRLERHGRCVGLSSQ